MSDVQSDATAKETEISVQSLLGSETSLGTRVITECNEARCFIRASTARRSALEPVHAVRTKVRSKAYRSVSTECNGGGDCFCMAWISLG